MVFPFLLFSLKYEVWLILLFVVRWLSSVLGPQDGIMLDRVEEKKSRIDIGGSDSG